jgi:hypothetical protein
VVAADGERGEHRAQRGVRPDADQRAPQGGGAPHAEQQLVGAGVVDDQHAVPGEPGAQLGDHRRGHERQVTGQDGDDVALHGRQARGECGHRPAAGRLLPHHQHAVGHRLWRADDHPRAGALDRGEHGGEHAAAADLELGLGLAAQALGPAPGEHHGGEGRESGHGRER